MTQIKAMVAKLADDMKQHPDDIDGWLRLGRSTPCWVSPTMPPPPSLPPKNCGPTIPPC